MSDKVKQMKIAAKNDECIIRLRGATPKYFGRFIVEMKNWPCEDIFGPLDHATTGKFEVSKAKGDNPTYDRITELLERVGLTRENREISPRYHVYRADHISTIYITLARGYYLKEEKDMLRPMSTRPYMTYNTINSTPEAILRVRPERRIEEGLNRHIVQMCGWPLNHIFGDVPMVGTFKRSFYDSTSVYFIEIQRILSSLGLTNPRSDVFHSIEVRRYAEEQEIAILVPDEYVLSQTPVAEKITMVDRGGRPEIEEFNLADKTEALLKGTAADMAGRLAEFEDKNPEHSVSWQAGNWSETCVKKIYECLNKNKITDAMNFLMFAKHHDWDVSRLVAVEELPVTKASDEDERTIPYTFATIKDYEDYKGLYSVLMDALDQAAYGKGKDRHANDLPFEDQRMQSICHAQGSTKGMGYQVIKKILESDGMEHSAKRRELLGAVVYAAGMILWEDNQSNKE